MPFHKKLIPFLFDPTGLGRKAIREIGRAFKGPDPLRADDPRLNIDPDNLLRQRFEDLNPDMLFAMFSDILRGSSLTPQQFLGPGVSGLQASEQAEAFNRRREGQAFGAASQTALDFEQLRGEALADIIAANQYKSSAELYDRYFRSNRSDDFLQAGFNAFGQGAGLALGAPGAGQVTDRPGTTYPGYNPFGR